MKAMPGQQQCDERSLWRFFPLWVVAAFLLVFAANGGLIFSALSTFPGETGDDGFSLSNSYDRILRIAESEARLGWQVEAQAEGGRVGLALRAADGSALDYATVTGTAERPIGPPTTTRLRFHRSVPGLYAADAVLPLPGQWDVLIDIESEGHHLHATRRVIVR